MQKYSTTIFMTNDFTDTNDFTNNGKRLNDTN